MRVIPPSELIINGDGSIFHLHVKPEQIATTIILCGDPERVSMIASHFDSIECDILSREFHTMTGMYKGKRISAVSHGIGPDNIDIVLTELDALVNVDFATRTIKPEHTTLTLVRIGTSGGLQEISPVGTYVVSKYSMGFDGVLNYYKTPDGLMDLDMEAAFCKHVSWNPRLAQPYCVKADEELVERIGFDMVKGITIAAPGFYGPQGRYVRAEPADLDLNKKIQSFEYKGDVITNFEMEGSMVAGLGKLLGHKAMTVCAIIAGRVAKNMNTDYHGSIEGLVEKVLERI
ncbi:MAG: nucleoside phosphorylase [Paludibacteraceae bacterium]|nr:nucleoside phosphorylase [Bacteroidales bacterium]MDY4512157.1 nucleoside phosphorylase [Paludibacteraceae bacterium]MCI7430816.1 nucleoside phosphorylase [Bacteroidales bacterium]MDD6641761.1 nucleoside phosphorylase [Bacteroidales bacterium]MDD6782724.1 nucleoside phosphorylase [Bacteroidales bacterium]